jgi:allantoin racemase
MEFQMKSEQDRRPASIPRTSPAGKRIMVLNPNTNPRITDLLGQAARNHAPPGCTIISQNVAAGRPALRDAADLAVAEQQVLAMVRTQPDLDGLVIAAFGDPGLQAAQAMAPYPVAGLGASGLAAGAAHGSFAILTLGPQMDAVLRTRIAESGFIRQLTSLRYLNAQIPEVAENPLRFLPLIEAEASIAAQAGAKALLLGGAPFAGLGQQARADIPVIDGLKAALLQVMAEQDPQKRAGGVASTS